MPEAARLTEHPRALRSIQRAKALAALAGLVVAVAGARAAELPWFDALARGLAFGVVAWLAAWALAVVAWRQLARGEMEVAREKAVEQVRELEAYYSELAREAREREERQQA
jgi:hypothetical protein